MRRFRTYAETAGDPGGDVHEQVSAQMDRLARRLEPVRAVWLVASGKGGVGKSAVTANLAAALARRGLAVGALDADLNGPSLARMLGAERSALIVGDDAVRPAAGREGVRVMSMDLLLEARDPVRWREPAEDLGFVWQSTLETGTLREFLGDVDWGPLDVLLLDLPPGTDKLGRAARLVPRTDGILLVTTPSEAARAVVARSVELARDLGPAHLGLVANMTAHVCPACGHHQPLFPDDGARTLAGETGVPLWAEIPFSPALARETDAGRPPVLGPEPRDPAGSALLGLADRVAGSLAARATPTAQETP